MGRERKVRMKDQIKLMEMPKEQEILVKVLGKQGGPKRRIPVKDLSEKDLRREVIKVQMNSGGMSMGYSGVLFLLR